jgi:hypothetical protein
MTADDDRPFVVESPTKIKLGPEAKYWAEQHGVTLTEMGRYLLQQHATQQAAQESESNFEGAGAGLSGEPSENIEDRRQDPEYVRDHWLEQYAPGPAPNAQTFGPGGLSSALGFGDIVPGTAPAPPPVFGPTKPQYPPAFGFQYGGRLRAPLPPLPGTDH